ncbi:50S ribosomal protein L32e [Candidatus Woesearchaeota archaeon CG_4_10_14_0_8_um_filter_47_5]|nr:MAG: 50S ribosomal protein L32e [Candidatus Woesearchaeota archaeon CG_4_10_14_0_8_um_filter_47_5]
MKQLLEARKQLKKRKPHFIQQDAYKLGRIDSVWKKPRGKTPRVRLKMRGQTPIISQGWRSPKAVRGLHPTGVEQVIINTPSQIALLDPKKQGALVAKNVGTKKKVEIVTAGLAKGITFLNIKDPQGFIDRIAQEQAFKKDKKEEAKTRKEKEKKKEEGKEPASIEETLESDQDKKHREKKEKDKALITTK